MSVMSDKIRFWSKVEKSGDCWIWTGSKRRRGYGLFYTGKKGRHSAHRWAYEFFNGPIPSTTDVCHTCDNPGCVRRSHLFAGSRNVNMFDMKQKGRGANQWGKY